MWWADNKSITVLPGWPENELLKPPAEPEGDGDGRWQVNKGVVV